MTSVKIVCFMHSHFPLLIHIIHCMKGTKQNSPGLRTFRLIIHPRSAKGVLMRYTKDYSKQEKSKTRSTVDIGISLKESSVLFMNKE